MSVRPPRTVGVKPLPRSQTQFSDADFLGEFDLTHRGLSRVRKHFDAGDLPKARSALVEYFRTRRRPRWLFDLRDGRRGEVCHLWQPELRCRARDHLSKANLALDNHFVLVDGIEREFGPDLDWVTPETRSLMPPGNLFKCCHVLRHLAVAHASTRKAVYAAKFAELASRWVSDWPLKLDRSFTGEAMIFSKYYGEKTMPAGHRLFNWITCLQSGILFAPSVPGDTAFAFIKAMWFAAAAYQHFARLAYKHTDPRAATRTYNVPGIMGAHSNHHLMCSGNVPAVMGMFFPETPRLQSLIDLARKNLALHADGSFLSDGGYRERSSGYSAAALSMFLAPLVIAKLNRVRLLDRKGLGVIRKASEQIAQTVLPSGHLPPVGDSFPPAEPEIAGVLGLADFVYRSEICATVLRRTGLTRHLPASLRPDAARTKARLPTAIRYPATGIGIIRSSWQRTASAMTINIPDGDNTYTGHAHDDSLSVSFVGAGVPFLWLPANELYDHVNGKRYFGTEFRGYLYSELSKNVVLVRADLRQLPLELADSWGARTIPVDSSLEIGRRRARLRTSQLPHRGSTRWRREIGLYNNEWAIRDRVEGSSGGRRRHTALFHFAYGVDLSETKRGFAATRDGVRVHIQFSDERLGAVRLRRNVRWLRPNAHRRDQPAPWTLEVRFGGSDDDSLLTRLTVRE